MKFACEVCNYNTNDKSNYNKHLGSKIHILKSELKNETKPKKIQRDSKGSNRDPVEIQEDPVNMKKDIKPIKSYIKKNTNSGEFVCEICGTSFKQKTNLYRHRKHRCTKNLLGQTIDIKQQNICIDSDPDSSSLDDDSDISSEYIVKKQSGNSDVNNLHDKLKKKNKRMKELERKLIAIEAVNNVYKTENEYHKMLTTNAGDMMGRTMGALTYILTKYDKAPCIKRLDDESAKNLLTYETKDGKLTKQITNKTPIQYIIDLCESNKLIPHLGNIIISQYKQMYPENQSMWNTDASRLTYVVKDTVGDKTTWGSDKRGIKINEYIIKPLIAQLSNLISEYDKLCYKNFDNMTDSQRDKYAENSKYTISLRETINSGTINKKLLRYITPYFFISERTI
jgi:hypothetical protein